MDCWTAGLTAVWWWWMWMWRWRWLRRGRCGSGISAGWSGSVLGICGPWSSGAARATARCPPRRRSLVRKGPHLGWTRLRTDTSWRDPHIFQRRDPHIFPARLRISQLRTAPRALVVNLGQVVVARASLRARVAQVRLGAPRAAVTT